MLLCGYLCRESKCCWLVDRQDNQRNREDMRIDGWVKKQEQYSRGLNSRIGTVTINYGASRLMSYRRPWCFLERDEEVSNNQDEADR